jgi:hypothetical protein
MYEIFSPLLIGFPAGSLKTIRNRGRGESCGFGNISTLALPGEPTSPPAGAGAEDPESWFAPGIQVYNPAGWLRGK